MMDYIIPDVCLTVIIRDDGPMVHCNDSPSYRSVKINLTNEQLHLLRLNQTYTLGGKIYHEQIGSCFLEDR